MIIEPTSLPGIMEIRAEPHADERGLFARTYDQAIFQAAGLPIHWPQCNTSWNRLMGTLRGLHYQTDDAPEPKLVRCTAGRVFDVAVDLRLGSATLGSWVGIELSAAKRNALYIPPGFAHGFQTLEDGCEVFYQMGTNYKAGSAAGVRWNDPAFTIDWPLEPTSISERDATYDDFVR